jgi:D-alanyl-D-alanine dipeptidase
MPGGARANRGCRSYPPVCPLLVMPGFMPAIHVFNKFAAKQDVDGRNKSGHDGV